MHAPYFEASSQNRPQHTFSQFIASQNGGAYMEVCGNCLSGDVTCMPSMATLQNGQTGALNRSTRNDHVLFLVLQCDVFSLVPRPSPAPFFYCFCILQVIKNWSWGRPGNEAKQVWIMTVMKGSHLSQEWQLERVHLLHAWEISSCIIECTRANSLSLFMAFCIAPRWLFSL